MCRVLAWCEYEDFESSRVLTPLKVLCRTNIHSRITTRQTGDSSLTDRPTAQREREHYRRTRQLCCGYPWEARARFASTERPGPPAAVFIVLAANPIAIARGRGSVIPRCRNAAAERVLPITSGVARSAARSLRSFGGGGSLSVAVPAPPALVSLLP